MALLVERILGIVGPDAGHDARGDERGDVIDVAVGLLGVDALLDPDDLLDTQVILEVLVHVGAKLLAPGLELLWYLGQMDSGSSSSSSTAEQVRPGESRHWSVTTRVPSPSTVMEPPSRIMSSGR